MSGAFAEVVVGNERGHKLNSVGNGVLSVSGSVSAAGAGAGASVRLRNRAS